jgi:penicillin-binding protein 1A
MSRLQRQRRRARGRGGAHRILFLGLGVLVTGVAIGAIALVAWIVSVATSGPSLDARTPINLGATSRVYAADGQRLGFIQANELRLPIPTKDIPQNIKDATVAVEDRRFYQHEGVDLEGVVRAAIKNLESGDEVQGGSTLTMQLVRNLYTGERDRTFKRKIREAKLAEDLENRHPGRLGKQWILNKYLNSVPYGTVGGQTALGIQAAARIFFDKSASDLKVHEAALLAGLPQAPSEYNPFTAEQKARARRNDVLQRMADQGYIKQVTADRTKAMDLGVKSNRYFTARREGYFFDYVKQQLIDDPDIGLEGVRRGGLRIDTTIDLRMQKAARKAMDGQLGDPNRSAAIVTIDPRTGYIKAMASSSRYGDSKFNLAAQGHRQPGSAFKTMVLMAALRRGVSPVRTSYTSKPLRKGWLPTAPDYEVKTYADDYPGRMNLVRATLRSDNSVFAQLAADLGPEAVKQTAQDLGIKTKLDGYPAEALGGLRIGVTPLEMANAYATIASGGWRYRPQAITRITFPDGKVENVGKPRKHKAFDAAVTNEARKILEQNVESGTGFPNAKVIGCPAAGKTGTTDKNVDAWFVGFTPHLATAVWLGHARSRIEMPGITGGTIPAKVWGRFMKVARGTYCGDFKDPAAPFQARPFFGDYSSSGGTRDDLGTDPADPDAFGGTAPEAAGGQDDGGTGENGFGTPGTDDDGEADDSDSGRRFPPEQYDSPPQEAPVPLPGGPGGGAAAPPPG